VPADGFEKDAYSALQDQVLYIPGSMA
jgi:hypothetical protein